MYIAQLKLNTFYWCAIKPNCTWRWLLLEICTFLGFKHLQLLCFYSMEFSIPFNIIKLRFAELGLRSLPSKFVSNFIVVHTYFSQYSIQSNRLIQLIVLTIISISNPFLSNSVWKTVACFPRSLKFFVLDPSLLSHRPTRHFYRLSSR